MKKLTKNLKKLIATLIILVIGYLSFIEYNNILIDRYNFEQLEKVKEIISNDNKYDIAFQNLSDFNSIYKSNIKPIKNCYYIRSNNSENNIKYNFSFKLYSRFYRLINFSEYFIYPKYNIPIDNFCGGGSKCTDINYEYFIKTISNPCEN